MAKTVLIVDDEAANCLLIGNYLKSHGYSILTAKNGNEGYRLFREEFPDLVLADVLMPQCNGPDMVKNIRGMAEGEKVPVIMMTSIVKSYKLEREALNKWGANAYLQKPFEMPTLLKKVQDLIGDGDLKPDRKKKVEEAIAGEAPKALSGTFADKSYSKVLHLLYKRKTTGMLNLHSERKRITIFFDNGRPIDIRSNYIQEDSLTRILKTMVTLTEDQILQAGGLMDSRGLQQGQALVEIGAITRDELSSALRIQAEEKIVNPFGWKEGSFSFTEQAVVQDADLMLRTPLPQIVLRGIAQHYTSERIRKSFKNKQNRRFYINPKSAYRLEDFGLPPDELFVASLAKTEPTVSQILNYSKVGTVRTYQILYVMFLLEAFKFMDEENAESKPQEAAKDKEPETEDLCLSYLMEEVSEDLAEQHYQRGMEYCKNKEFKGAANAFVRAININNRVPKYLAQLALTIYQMPLDMKASYIDPNKIIQRAANLDRNSIQLNVVMGQLSKEHKDFDKAKRFFERVLDVDPNHEEAKAELRLIDIKKRRDQQMGF